MAAGVVAILVIAAQHRETHAQADTACSLCLVAAHTPLAVPAVLARAVAPLLDAGAPLVVTAPGHLAGMRRIAQGRSPPESPTPA